MLRAYDSHRWSQGLLFHQAMVDCARAAILIPLAHSLLYCVPVKKCSLVETAFLLLVTVSTINMLTIVLNDSPVFPEDDEEDGYQVIIILQVICLSVFNLIREKAIIFKKFSLLHHNYYWWYIY